MQARSITMSHARGQGATEYILLIVLIIIFIVAFLIQFRDSVNVSTSKVIEWIEGEAGLPSAASAPPPETPTPAPSPSPTMEPEDWAAWIEGQWCHAPSGVVVMLEVDPAWVTSLGSERFRVTNSENPDDYRDYERLPDGSFRMTYRSLDPDLGPSEPYTRY